VEVASLMDARVGPPEIRVANLIRQVFEDTTRPERPLLSKWLDLPSDIRSKLGNPDDPVEIVRALLEAAGLPVQVQDEVVLSQSHAIVVLRTDHHQGGHRVQGVDPDLVVGPVVDGAEGGVLGVLDLAEGRLGFPLLAPTRSETSARTSQNFRPRSLRRR
jgi:hypothetical protein